MVASAALAAALLPAVALRGVLPGVAGSGTGDGTAATKPGDVQALLDAIDGALSQLAPLQAQVDAGQIIPKFGEKAQQVVAAARSKAGAAAASDVERVVDGALQALFLRQVSLLGQQVAAKFEGAQARDSAAQADKQFLTEASDLLRPGSGWSIEREREEVQGSVEAGLRHRAALVEERARAARLQQTTIDVIGKLQERMEYLQQKVQGARAGSPWVLSTSYRIPKTPLQLVGRYEQGRANLELNLTPDKDPGNSEASFADGIGPANIGVSFNVGM